MTWSKLGKYLLHVQVTLTYSMISLILQTGVVLSDEEFNTILYNPNLLSPPLTLEEMSTFNSILEIIDTRMYVVAGAVFETFFKLLV